jgi:hypothetical protein
MPKSILTRFIVERHGFIELQTLVWKTGVVLNNASAKAEVIEYYRHDKGEIRIRVSGRRVKDLLTVVSYELDRIHDSCDALKYKKIIPCNCATCQGSQAPWFYPLEYLHKRLDDRKYQIECQNSYAMVDVRRLIIDSRDDRMSGRNEVLQKPILDPDRQRESWPVQHLPEQTDEKAIFVSYAWGGESENIANQVGHAFSEKGVTIIRDKREMRFKDRIKDFMERIGRGKCVIVVISEKYLKSENCMFELV